MDSTLSLSTAVTRVTIFLTEKLISSYPDHTLAKLQWALKDNLTTHYAPYWDVQKPIKGSARRSMTLSPMCLPPRPIWSACATANVQWFDWISLLGNKEFDLFVDPGCIAVRCQNMVYSVWTADPVSSAAAVSNFAPATINSTRTFAQQLIGNDSEEDQLLFQVLADEINSGPVRAAPISAQIAIPARSTSPLSEHSRCSSRSSNSNSSGASAFSFTSDTSSSHTSMSASTTSSKGDAKQSRRERLRQSRVFVDTSKTEVTPYDGGKTTVLTGGVMLGGGPKAAKPKALLGDNTWRAIRD
jgi:BTG family